MTDEALSKKQRVSDLISIPFVIMLVFSLAAVLGLTGCTGPGSDTTIQTTSEQAATIQTTTTQTTATQTASSNQAEMRGKFSKEDLLINGISYGATPDDFNQTLGTPLKEETRMDQVTGHDLLTYTYEGLQLIFKNDSQTDELFHLKTVESTIPGNIFAHGLQVGDSVQKVINSFEQDENGEIYQGYTLLYGDPDLLDSKDATGEVAFAYYDDTQAYFLSMTPPYMSGYATVYDEMAILQFTFENEAVTSIRWMLGPGAE